ncbi:DNA repair protein RecN [Costertonia aggregata]|uniref:DNA repair protein RecN n=1 Tax=Costertonia aggregata TaxID=343403 RepID=A0A7H9AJX5_9FLAO|nr:DNA repair protein RecN [Costertonia aggregata]QLG43846.1 DNA repair protein RecN [Costertonia aggregata]
MLTNLSIKNYALIDQLNVSFGQGFTIITGETGAGKSILLGGLSLVLGKRADLSALRNTDEKCIIEAEFSIEEYHLKSFFSDNDLDYEPKTIIRREILPSGKSRAFINDTPITLGILSKLGNRLIDVHSQHQTLQLTDNDFQLKVIDALANNTPVLKEYRSILKIYRKAHGELEEMEQFQQNSLKELDYNSFLLKELESAPLKAGVLEELEEHYEQLSNVETIMEQLSKGHQLLNDEQIGIVNLLTELKVVSNRLSTYGNSYNSLNERIQSVFLEIDDIADELQSLESTLEADPNLLEEVNGKLQLLYDLQKKHAVQSIEDLLKIKEELAQKVDASENITSQITKKEAEIKTLEKELTTTASTLHTNRAKVIPVLQKQLAEKLSMLGMPNATFKIALEKVSEFKSSGTDDLVFLFSANKGGSYGELKKVASGGELSRIMLTIKSILTKYEQLPTMMFDEIDTGVSGEISNQMGEIMHQMSRTMQVFSITHLPQVASKGDNHYKVYKEDDGESTHTKMKQLSKNERIVELAEMLGGKSLSDSAMAHAKELLN